MKFFSSAFDFHKAKLYLVNCITAKKENELLRFYTKEENELLELLITHDACCDNKEGYLGGEAPQTLVW